MKNTFLNLPLFTLLSIILIGCQQETNSGNVAGTNSTQDSLKTRTLHNRKTKILVKDAFIHLSQEELVLDGIQNMSQSERKALLGHQVNDNYRMQWAGNYLEITEKTENEDDKDELFEKIRLAAFNSMNEKSILFVSQELIDEQRKTVKVLHQSFLQSNHNTWEIINSKLPKVTTQTFLEDDANIAIEKDHIFFELKSTDVNYLQAHLIHENYPDKNEIAEKEAYKVAYVWTGNNFRLDRQSLVLYDISEHHN